MRTLGLLLICCLCFSCDPLVKINHIVENRSSDSVDIVIRNKKQSYDTLTLSPAGETQISFDDAIKNDVRSLYNEWGDSVRTAIVKINKGEVECKKNWKVKSNWVYKEFDEKTAEIRFIVTDSDFE